MLNQHSLEEIAEIHNLLGDIKKEYENGIKPILIKNSPKLCKNYVRSFQLQEFCY